MFSLKRPPAQPRAWDHYVLLHLLFAQKPFSILRSDMHTSRLRQSVSAQNTRRNERGTEAFEAFETMQGFAGGLSMPPFHGLSALLLLPDRSTTAQLHMHYARM